ncbi:rhodanese-like domain-containing protein [Polynucleobacter kasalickyi]|uniref:Rhodanese-related sulfurtransferase n=1 Tax=Polynucleobacter kasalickyi TaxID=1938817 RepID=A0A1W2BVM4_9BURK|nr:rhodanese-like domain-containing protein [Polynucleobacter kasalickyi]SMC77043.1 Rhodanese-related sulfurtransferase [Polynucleobacter kasalickyi]
MEIQSVDAKTLKQWLHGSSEIAVFDVREQGQYGEAHLFLATSVPYSRLEYDVARLAPRKSVRLVVYDNNGAGISVKAAQALLKQGYQDIYLLSGGTQGWLDAGFTLFAGVNLPSKTFGELVEHQCHTPRVSAHEVMKMRQNREDFIILDGRPQGEFKKMSIPGAQCCPNGELAYRIKSHVKNQDTKIIINCAGRTRSIIGAQTLINLGIKNPIFALENGTQGWYLNDYVLDHGKVAQYAPPFVDDEILLASKALVNKFDIPLIADEQFLIWNNDENRSLYLLDVRTAEEFTLNGLPGAQHAPGGQLIQATDQFVGVRNARIVLYDSDGVRAITVASWLKQMGHDVAVLRDGVKSKVSLPTIQIDHSFGCMTIKTDDLNQMYQDDSVTILDIRGSMQYRRAHVPNSLWAIRPKLKEIIRDANQTILMISDDPALTYGALLELDGLNLNIKLYELDGAGFPKELETISTETIPPDLECIDFLFFVHDRHDGNKDAARRYLEWETGLIAQLDQDEINLYSIQ